MNRPMNLKTIGILGGMSDRATTEYYRMINQEVNNYQGNWDIAETIVMGVNFGNIEYFVRNKKWEEARSYLLQKAMALASAGADVIICVSNTMHRVLADVSDLTGIPFIHICDPTGQAIVSAGLTKLGLIGTKPVMEDDYIANYYREGYGIEIIVPPDEQQKLVDQIIFDELVKGKIHQPSKLKYIEICKGLQKNGAEGIILGCSEIFLLIEQSDTPEIPLFNTTALHVKAAASFAIGVENTNH